MRESKPKSTPRSSAATPSASENRSDQIRRRRTEKSRQPVLGTQGRNGSRLQRKSRPSNLKRPVVRNGPPAPPPVMARGTVASPLSHDSEYRTQSKRVQRARRTYNIAVGSQGAEMRLPAIPNIHFGWRMASFVIAGLLIFCLYQMWNAPLYRVTGDALHINGLQRLSDSAVRTVLAVENKPVFVLDTQQMQQNLLTAFPEFSAAVVAVELPHSVVITVTERVPVLIWRQDGRTNLVDGEGMLFPLRDESVQTTYPVVEARYSPPAPFYPTADNEQSSSAEKIKTPEEILKLYSSASAFSGTTLDPARPFMFPEMVSAILSLAIKAPEGAVLTYDSLHGLGWKDRRGWEVYFGDILEAKHGDIEMKLHVYKSILEYLKAQDTKPALISVEYVHAPYYRLAGESGN